MESNIHLTPTDKPSKLIKNNLGYGIVSDPWKEFDINLIQAQFQNIYITDNSEIREGDWFINESNQIEKGIKYYNYKVLSPESKKIILTTDRDLIQDGVQFISDEFLEWFVKNPSCKGVEIKYRYNFYAGKDLTHYKIIIPQEEPKQLTGIEIAIKLEEIEREELKQETIEESAINYAHNYFNMHETNNYQALKQGFENGAKSDAAKEYWYKKFWEDYESQFKNQNNER
jgi:hypothetical protein